MPKLSLLLVLLLAWAPAQAQGDLESERQSLAGISSFSVGVTIEGPEQVASSDALNAKAVTDQVMDRLREAGLPVGSASAPTLHIHVNVMQLEKGLVPFSIELGFLQEVQIVSSGRRMAAETWNESVVGLVSHDRIPTIADSIESLIDQFARDFQDAR